MLPLAFGETGLQVHPLLREALAAAAGRNAYAPVVGLRELREAAAGYWARRGLPTIVGGRLRARQQAAAVRTAASHGRRRGGAEAELGQLRRPGRTGRCARA